MILVHYAAPRFVSVSSFDIFLRALLHARDISAPAAIHPRGEWTRGERKRGRERAWTSCTRACWCIYLYVFYNSRKQEWAVRNKTRVIIRGILHSTSRLFKSRNSKIRVRWMNVSSPKNSSSKVEFNLQLNPCFFVCSQRVEFVIRVVSYWNFYF